MEKDWRELFALETDQEEREPEVHEPGECNMSCLMAREIKYTCRRGGANHGVLVKQDLAWLDECTAEDKGRNILSLETMPMTPLGVRS